MGASQRGDPAPPTRPKMAASQTPVELFNRSLVNFIDALQPLIGHMPQYKPIAMSAKLLSRIGDPRRNVDFFNQYVAQKYSAMIVARDETFMLAEQFSESDDQDIVQLLKGTWKTLSAEEKDAIWQHMEVLLTLCRSCQAVLP